MRNIYVMLSSMLTHLLSSHQLLSERSCYLWPTDHWYLNITILQTYVPCHMKTINKQYVIPRYIILYYYHSELYSFKCQFYVHSFLIDLLEKNKTKPWHLRLHYCTIGHSGASGSFGYLSNPTTACLSGTKHLYRNVQAARLSGSSSLVLTAATQLLIVHVLWMPPEKSFLNSLSIDVSCMDFVILFKAVWRRKD